MGLSEYCERWPYSKISIPLNYDGVWWAKGPSITISYFLKGDLIKHLIAKRLWCLSGRPMFERVLRAIQLIMSYLHSTQCVLSVRCEWLYYFEVFRDMPNISYFDGLRWPKGPSITISHLSTNSQRLLVLGSWKYKSACHLLLCSSRIRYLMGFAHLVTSISPAKRSSCN